MQKYSNCYPNWNTIVGSDIVDSKSTYFRHFVRVLCKGERSKTETASKYTMIVWHSAVGPYTIMYLDLSLWIPHFFDWTSDIQKLLKRNLWQDIYCKWFSQISLRPAPQHSKGHNAPNAPPAAAECPHRHRSWSRGKRFLSKLPMPGLWAESDWACKA